MLLGFYYWNLIIIQTAWCSVDLFDHSTSIAEYFTSYDCIRYHGILRSQSQALEYCIRKIATNKVLDDIGVPDVSDRRFTFHELKELNFSAETILRWSRSMNLVEMYVDYINQPQKYESIGNTTVYQCTEFWFGSKCQYSLGIGSSYTIHDVIRQEIGRQFPYDSEKAELPCFLGFQCLRNNETFCLDWREICNGEVDCYDGAEDEAFCHEIEFNECSETEYRCKNGQCIPMEQSSGEFPFCLDGSNLGIDHIEQFDSSENIQCFPPHTLVDEAMRNQRARGYCESVRNLFRWTWISNIKTLNQHCWQLLICLTHVRIHSDGSKCKEFVKLSNLSVYYNFCENITMFPENPVVSNHVHFLYEPHNLTTYYMLGILLPTYICFNPDLCEHLHPTYRYRNLTCLPSATLDISKGISAAKNRWKFIIDQIRKEFHKCFIHPNDRYLHSRLLSNKSAYCCQNSSKCISRHRVMDDVIDCPFEDDEQAYEISCSIKQRLSYRCSSEPYCRSHFLSFKLCPNQFMNFDQLLFTEICDRTVHALPIEINGKNHTDETDCELWNCNNTYTRCDGYWNCPNGEDEFKCPGRRSRCPRGTFECVSIHNLTMVCLFAYQVLDGIHDCLGGIDEADLCRRTFRLMEQYSSFICRNETKCLDWGYLCDKKSDCLTNDDEIFCETRRFSCRLPEFNTGNMIEKFTCNNVFGRRYLFQYSMWPVYSTRKQISFEQNQSDQENQETNQHSTSCFRGISVRYRVIQNEYKFKCFCPAEYYGDRCQYQTKRVLLIFIVHTPRPKTSISFFTVLVDDNDEYQTIYSYQQIHNLVTGDFCRATLRMTLIHPDLTRNLSKNYSIRIEGFDRSSMVFLASWHYNVLYTFLPVYSLVISLHIPIHTISVTGSCFPVCEHGQCTKYLNEDKSYCRCYPGWIGIRCQKKVISKECDPKSILIGYQMNRAICLCPDHVYGERCMMKSSHNLQSKNHNQPIFNNGRINYGEYDAVQQLHNIELLSSDAYVEFEFIDMKVPSYILIHFFDWPLKNYTANRPKIEMIPLKVPLFQSSVKLNFEYSVDFLIVQLKDSVYFHTFHKAFQNMSMKLRISPDKLCPEVSSLLYQHLIHLPRIQQIKYYHQICYNHSNLVCFVDELFLCICTIDRQVDCMHFDRRPKCNNRFHCLNEAQCFQNDPDCPTKTICVCKDCFFGDRCQFYARGIGLTLDDILRVQIRPGIPFHRQSLSVILTAVFVGIVSIVIFINGILSLMTFQNKKSREVGTGLYLLASAVSSIMIALMVIIKYSFIIITHIDLSIAKYSMRIGCKTIEFLLKSTLAIDSWYKACVAFERLVNIYLGISFSKKKSKVAAKWIITFLPLVVGSTLSYELIYRDLSDDEEMNRSWCILQYSRRIQNYSSAILFIHIIGPFMINLSSAMYIIVKTARQKSASQKQKTLKQHFLQQVRKHKHLIYSPLILVTLSIPRLVISLLTGCMKSSNHSWIYLLGYFVSFIPSMLMFLIFVSPSQTYKEEFRKIVNNLLSAVFQRRK